MSGRRIGRVALLLAAGLVIGALLFGGESFLELWFVDLRFSLLSARVQEDPSKLIAIITMDDYSEKELDTPFGAKWRQFHPVLIQKLKEAGASLTVFDNWFNDEETEWDQDLAAAVAKAGNVVAADNGSPMQKSLHDAFLAFGNLAFKPTAPVPKWWRSVLQKQSDVPRFVAVGSLVPPALMPLSLVAVENYAKRTPISPGPDPRFLRQPGFWVNYHDPPEHFLWYSYADVLNAKQGRMGNKAQTPMSAFKDRIVFIGKDIANAGDSFALPNTVGKKYPGVYGQAYATDTILKNQAVSRASPLVDGGITLAFLSVLLLILEIRARKTRTLLIVVLPIAVFLLYLALLSGFGLWPGYAPIFVAFWVVLILHWALVRVTLAASLSRAVGFDPRLIDAFRREGTREGGPVRKTVSILIADVRNYTLYVSRTDAASVSLVMNEYMEAMEHCVTAQGGYVNKYVGDEVVAVFGFPLDPDRCAERAVRSGLTMLEELGKLIVSWKERGLVIVERIGIGIDTGPVFFTEVGGRTKKQFDIIGDCINGASRIEHLTKEFGHPLLISEDTYRGLESEDSLSGSFAPLKTVEVRGLGERKIFGLLNKLQPAVESPRNASPRSSKVKAKASKKSR